MSDPLYRKEILRLAADAAGAGRLAEPGGSVALENREQGGLRARLLLPRIAAA